MAEWIDGKTIVTIEEGVKRTRQVFEPSICAHRPGKPFVAPNTPRTAEQEAQSLLDDLVGENQRHKCAVAANGCKKTESSPCKRHFDRFVVNDKTTFDDRDRPLYRRPKEQDLDIVGYNPRMLLDWGAHLNVESATSVLSILYLYDYLFKGNGKVIAHALSSEEIDAMVDEINIYLKGRILCGHDAFNRGLGYDTYPPTFPSVTSIAVKTESQVRYYVSKGVMTDMYVYMATRHIPALAPLTFQQLFTMYFATYDTPTTARLERGAEYAYEILSPSSKRLYVCKYIRQTVHIVCLEMLFPNVGDAFYVRLILRHRAVSSWIDLRSFPPVGEVGSVEYVNHQDAARAAGYLVEELYDEALVCFQEAVLTRDRTPTALRALFSSFTVDGFNTGTMPYGHLYSYTLTCLSLHRQYPSRSCLGRCVD